MIATWHYAGETAPIFPLDDVGGVAPSYAYSMHKLSASYAGSALRVRRPSDSVEQDIGFVGQFFDSASMFTFLGTEIGRVVTWYDQSGNGNNATQATAGSQAYIGLAKINGYYCVHCVGGSLALPAINFNSQAFDGYLVAELISSSQPRASLLELGTGVNRATFFSYDGWTLRGSTKPGTAPNTFVPQSRAAVFEYRLGASETSLFMGAESMVSTALASFTLTGGDIANSEIAASMDKLYQAVNIGYARILSAGERTTIRASLNSLYGITETRAARVLFDGDSICVGADATGVVIQARGLAKRAYELLSPKPHTYCTAQSGMQLTERIVAASFDATVLRFLDAYTSDPHIVLVTFGTNDLTIGGRTAAQIYADLQTYCAAVRAEGGQVIVCTILPNNAWNGTQQTTRNDYNTLVRTNWASFADGLCDYAVDPTMGPQAASADTTLYGDGLHVTELGHSYLAPITAAAVNALL
jgi:lysophospholipase L1-like esterase